MTCSGFIQELLIESRTALRMTVRDASRESGVPISTISRIESGGNATVSTLGKLAIAYDLDPRELGVGILEEGRKGTE